MLVTFHLESPVSQVVSSRTHYKGSVWRNLALQLFATLPSHKALRVPPSCQLVINNDPPPKLQFDEMTNLDRKR